MTSNYRVGTGIYPVTDRAVGLQMQGMADETQKTTAIESELFSRAFIIEDESSGRRVVIVSADIWTGTSIVKREVLRRLSEDNDEFTRLYSIENVLISGTHTHSAPGGYAGYELYDKTGGGFDSHTFDCVVEGIEESIRRAHENLGPGKIRFNKGMVQDCGRNRSLEAHLNNPSSERAKYPNVTDNEMLLLQFTQNDSNGGEQPVGVLTWYPIHPADRGQKNTLVCGDNKGYASALFESSMGMDPKLSQAETFIAAFANANAGDVSGNVEFGEIPNGIDDKAHMVKHGRQQFEVARQLFFSASEELSGSIDYRHTHVDMSHVVIENGGGARTWPAALGLSFAAGSTEDSIAYIAPSIPTRLREGITVANISVTEEVFLGVGGPLGGGELNLPDPSDDLAQGHYPKPILWAVGGREGVVPRVLPFQILKIGQLAITAVPGEITTMAGRRLRETVLGELSSAGVQHLALATYANDYSQYITTQEEYEMQHYEGASTLFGPHTLSAYQQEFRKLAIALRDGETVGASPEVPTRDPSPKLRRWTFRNESSRDVELTFYNVDELAHKPQFTLPNGTQMVPAGQEVAFAEGLFTGLFLPTIERATVYFNGADPQRVSVDDLVLIAPSGGIEVSPYYPWRVGAMRYKPLDPQEVEAA